MDTKASPAAGDDPLIRGVREGWHELTNRYYKRTNVYDMQWDEPDISSCHVAISTFGGLIAVAPDESKRSKEYSHAAPRNKVRIYTSSGKKICEFMWKYKSLVKMGWTFTEDLVVVIREYKEQVFVYSMHGEPINSFGIPGCKRVADCVIWGDGLVVRADGRNKYFAVTGFDNPSITSLKEPPVDFKPTAMVAVPAAVSPTKALQVLLASPQGPVFVVSHSEPREIKRGVNGPFVRMALCPSGRHLAAVNKKGTLMVLESDFSKTVTQLTTREKDPPLSIAWCGEDSVILYWDKLLFMVGPFGAWVAFKYPTTKPGSISLHTEVDGCRVVTSTRSEFLHRVQEQSESIFKAKAKSPAAQLLRASLAFERKDIAADLAIRKIMQGGRDGLVRLEDAIQMCLEAALDCFDTRVQTALLRAAAYGKLFARDETGELRTEFVGKCKLLRVLNNVRHFSVGMPLTYTQFEQLGIDILINRLVNRLEHLLAMRICDHMDLRQQKHTVLEHWACAKIRSSDHTEDHGALGKAIINKLDVCPGISFGRIARTAYDNELKELAINVLKHEPRAQDQVELLIQMEQDIFSREKREQDALALDKAIKSRDADLIYHVLLHYVETRLHDETKGGAGRRRDGAPITEASRRRQERRAEVYDILKAKPIARQLLLALYHSEAADARSPQGRKAIDMLKIIFRELEMNAAAAKLAGLENYSKVDIEKRREALGKSMKLYSGDPFAVAATKMQRKLLGVQQLCELELRSSFVDLSLNATLEKLIRLGETDRADDYKRSFGVPEKRYWHLQVRTLADVGDWAGLEALGSRRSNPIGVEPFIEACVEKKATQEAIKYIKKLSSANTKMEWFCSIQCYAEAAEVANDEKDLDALRYIASRAKSKPTVRARIDRMIQALS